MLVLIVCMVLAMLIAAEIVVTRANIKVVGGRTIAAQVSGRAVVNMPRQTAEMLARLPASVRAVSPNQVAPDSPMFEGVLQRQVESWSCISTGNARGYLYIGTQNTCNTSSSTNQLPVTVNNLTNTLQQVEIPLVYQYTAFSSDDIRRTRQTKGTISGVYAPSGEIPLSAAEIIADQLTTSFARAQVFDGLVHVNTQPALDQNSEGSIFLGGLSTAANALNWYGAALPQSSFGPNPAYPCDQQSASCIKFPGGVALSQPQVTLTTPDLTGITKLTLPSGVTDLILNAAPDGGTELFACSTTCERYWFKPNSQGQPYTLFKHRLISPVPPQNGTLFIPPEPTDQSNPWQFVSNVRPVVYSNSPLRVRALNPNGGAYSGLLSIISNDSLTLTTSIRAQTPICTTYPVIDAAGIARPAECSTGSNDALLLESTMSWVSLGSASLDQLPDGDDTFTVQAQVAAPHGMVLIGDENVSWVDIVGSIQAHVFKLDTRLRMAHDPRALILDGAPTFQGYYFPLLVTLAPDTRVDVP